MVTRPEIQSAADRLASMVRRTPCLRIEFRGNPVTLKMEFLQHTGSFKARGAFNSLLTTGSAGRAVVAASGGNHGAAVAFAARALGMPATIYVPEPTPATKLARIAAYGAEVVRGGASYAEALAASREFRARTNALEVHAYDDPAVLAGQGTIGLEMEQDAPDLTHLLVAVGGGGLLGGIASWYAGRGVSVIGVEPEQCPTLTRALAAGAPVAVEVSGVAADSLGARVAGSLVTEIAQANHVPTVLVSDDAIRDAQAWLWDELRVVAEPGGAAAWAALLDGRFVPPAGSRVGVILCGGNTDPASVARA